MQTFFFPGQRISWYFEILSDDRELLSLRESMQVVGCGLVDVVASGDPYYVRVIPEGSNEFDEPRKVVVIRRYRAVEVLEDIPVTCDEASEQ